MLILPLFFVLLVWYLIICYKWKKNIFDHIEKIPGAKWYPFFGTTYSYVGVSREDVLYKFSETIAKYRPFFKTWNGEVPEVNLMKPEHLQVIMRSSSHTTKGPFYQYIFPWLGEGLFISEGAKWFLQRKMLTPTFHFKILENFIQTFGKKAQLLVENLQQKADGQYFDIVPNISTCTLGIICETSMGVKLEEITSDSVAFVKKIYEITELVMWRYWRPYIKDTLFYMLPQGRQFTKILNYMDQISAKVIAHKREALKDDNRNINSVQNDESKCTSFLDIIMDARQNKEGVSDYDLRSLVNTFLLAGYETTGNATSWALLLLGNHPEVQEKVYEEVRRVLGDKPSPTTMEEFNQLKYLECVIKETLRLYPALPIITRRLTEDAKIDNYTIPAGTQTLLHIFQVHRDPEHFPDPEKFDPDRFLPENSKGRHPFAYIPFSAGPRNCIGMRFSYLEIRSVLATIIGKYKITSLEKHRDVRLFAHVIVRSQSGVKVKLETRQ